MPNNKIKMSVSKKPEPAAVEPEPEQQPEPEPEPEVETLAKNVAKDVAKTISKPKPKTKVPERHNPDDDLNIDPDSNYPKIALIRITVGDDHEGTMDEWLEGIRKDLSKSTKNTTVLTKHRLVNGKQVADHHYEAALENA